MNYEIKGDNLPVVECFLEAGEAINCENGAMSWKTGNMQMQTKGGGVGKMFSKIVSGEAMFHNTYTAIGGRGMIAFSSSFPGSIMAVKIEPGKDVICQKGAYLASTPGVEMSVFLQKKIGAGFFGGEGFIMQRLSGNGIAFIEIDGSCEVKHLEAGAQLFISTGYLAMMTGGCSIDVQTTGGAKNMLFGGEGFFVTVVSGPGDVYLQSMPAFKMAQQINMMAPGSKG